MKTTKQIMRKCLSIFLSALMLITYMPMQGFAQEFTKEAEKVVGIIPENELISVLKQLKVNTYIAPYKIGVKEDGKCLSIILMEK